MVILEQGRHTQYLYYVSTQPCGEKQTETVNAFGLAQGLSANWSLSDVSDSVKDSVDDVNLYERDPSGKPLLTK